MNEKKGYKVDKFTLDRGGIRKILQSDEMKAGLTQFAGQVGTGEVLFVFNGHDRAHVLVATGEEIRNDN